MSRASTSAALPLCACLLVLSGTGSAQVPGEADAKALLPSPPLFERNPLSRAQVLIYGRLALGYIKVDLHEPFEQRLSKVGSRTRSYLGLRASETLSHGFHAHADLEHSFSPEIGAGRLRLEDARPTDTGGSQSEVAGGARQPFWTGRSTVGLSHPDLGRIDLGLLDQPAWGVALRADPWAGNSVASPRYRLYLPPVRGSSSPGSTRSVNSITYASPDRHPWRVEVQVAALEDDPEAADRGGAVSYRKGPWYAGVGWQRWKGGTRALPLGVAYDFGFAKLFAAVTAGTVGGQDHRSAFVGLSWLHMGKGDPGRNEFRLGLSALDSQVVPSDMKLGAGYTYRLSLLTALQVNVGVTRRGGGRYGQAMEVGLVHAFSRDLFLPQPLR